MEAVDEGEEEGMTPQQEGRLEGLRYALGIVKNRRTLNRPLAYLAALQEMEIFLEASIERTENGEEMYSTATVQQPPQNK